MFLIFRIIETLCERGNLALEDRIGWSDNFMFIIDGASGLNGLHLTDFPSDAAWLAEKLSQGLKEHLLHAELPLSQILYQIADTLKAEYNNCLAQHGRSGAVDYPSAGVAILRLNDSKLEYLGLGDCTAVIETTSGTIEVLQEKQLTELDHAVIERMATLCRETGCSMREARKAVNDHLIHNRNLRNRPSGYWIFDPSGLGIPHARHKEWPASHIKSVSLMTDGFAQLAEPFAIANDPADIHAQIQTRGLLTLSNLLFSAQQADADCLSYPRFKTMDDTSAIWALVD